MQNLYDVAIIGGGPAGSSAAVHLAQAGHKVVVLERDQFPRFRIGESLLPYSMDALDHLGMRPWLEKHGFQKFGGEVATACGSRAVKFYFKDGFRLAHHSAFQVERAPFDQAILARAAECGAEIRERTRVVQVEPGPEDVALSLETGETVRARYVLDCAGRQSLLGAKYGGKADYPHLRKFSAYAHFRGVERGEGIDAGLSRLVRGDRSWFWFLPIDAERTSVGVVMDSADFRAWKCTPEEALQRAIDEAPLVAERMADATRVMPVQAVGDYSYRHTRLTGKRWMLVGDSAGFIDPIFSTGVFIALHSGEQCARAIDTVLREPARREKLFARYEKSMRRLMDMYLRFVTAWYEDEFVEVFTSPTKRLQLAPAVNAVLAGNIGNSFAIWWRMQLFYLVLRLQRHWPLCPRVARPMCRPPRAAEPEIPVSAVDEPVAQSVS